MVEFESINQLLKSTTDRVCDCSSIEHKIVTVADISKKYGKRLISTEEDGIVIEKKYEISDRLLGNVSSISNREVLFNTNDEWRLKVGGLSQFQFIIIKIDGCYLPEEYKQISNRLILARIIDPTSSPVEKDNLLHIFQLNKVQSYEHIDAFTIDALRWGSIRATILGTFYDEDNRIKFGNDLENVLSPINYSVYLPYDDDLEVLLNSFVNENEYKLGTLKYTETKPLLNKSYDNVQVNINITDIIGTNNNGQKTAIFGQARSGKSNAEKKLADGILEYTTHKNSNVKVGQLIIDPSGEYCYANSQDKGSLYTKYMEISDRYTINTDITLPIEEKCKNLAEPKQLKCNFYEDPYEGYTIIKELIDDTQIYMKEVLNINIPPEIINYNSQNRDEYNEYHKNISLWKALLFKSGFDKPENNNKIQIPILKSVREKLCLELNSEWLYAQNEIGDAIDKFDSEDIDISKANILKCIDVSNIHECLREKLEELKSEISKNLFNKNEIKEIFHKIVEKCNIILLDEFNKKYSNTNNKTANERNIYVDIEEVCSVYKQIDTIFKRDPDIFGDKKENYYNKEQQAILNAIADNGYYKNVATRLKEFKIYHTPRNAKNTINNIVNDVIKGKTIFIDVSRGNEVVTKYYSQKIAKSIFQRRIKEFSERDISDSFVILYVEEAHNLFPKDDSDLTNIYNRIAKEGPKYNISLIYATQSITSISPDLIKNTNNFIITTLDDEREIKELKRKRKIRDIADKAEQFSSKGFSLVYTKSHEFAIPVQIDKFIVK